MEILENLILPSNTIIVLLGAGILNLFLGYKRIGACIAGLSLFYYLFFATGPIAYFLLGQLEYRYSPLAEHDAVDARKIVVLTGYAEDDRRIPLSSRVNSSSAFRLLEAAKNIREGRIEEIIITGSENVPVVMKEVLVSIGVPEEKIIIENKSGNTFESAKNIRVLVGNAPFILVTSAGHMPRSMMVFSSLGMNPIPAPTDYLSSKNCLESSYLPSPLYLMYSDLAVHEYSAILYYSLRGWI